MTRPAAANQSHCGDHAEAAKPAPLSNAPGKAQQGQMIGFDVSRQPLGNVEQHYAFVRGKPGLLDSNGRLSLFHTNAKSGSRLT